MTNNVSNVSFQSLSRIVSGRNLCASRESQDFLLKFYKDEMKFTEEQIQKMTHRQNTIHQLEPNEVKTLRESVQKGIKKGDIALLQNSHKETFLLDEEDAFIGKALRARSKEKSLNLFDMWKNRKMKKPSSGRDSSQQAESSTYFEDYAAKIKEALLKKDKDTTLSYLASAVQKRTNMVSGDCYTRKFDAVSANICNRISEKTNKYVPYFYVTSR